MPDENRNLEFRRGAQDDGGRRREAADPDSSVCDIMLKALQARELGLSQINNVVRNVTKGVNAGLGDKGDVEKVLADAVAGMDDALLKVVEANSHSCDSLLHCTMAWEMMSSDRQCAQTGVNRVACRTSRAGLAGSWFRLNGLRSDACFMLCPPVNQSPTPEQG